MILNGECGQFSPKLLESFKNVFPTFMKLTYQYADGISLKATFAKEDLAEKENCCKSHHVGTWTVEIFRYAAV